MMTIATILGGLAGIGMVIWIDIFYESRQMIKELEKDNNRLREEINKINEENGWAQK